MQEKTVVWMILIHGASKVGKVRPLHRDMGGGELSSLKFLFGGLQAPCPLLCRLRSLIASIT